MSLKDAQRPTWFETLRIWCEQVRKELEELETLAASLDSRLMFGEMDGVVEDGDDVLASVDVLASAERKAIAANGNKWHRAMQVLDYIARNGNKATSDELSQAFDVPKRGGITQLFAPLREAAGGQVALPKYIVRKSSSTKEKGYVTTYVLTQQASKLRKKLKSLAAS